MVVSDQIEASQNLLFYLERSTRIFTCFSFSLINGRYPSSTILSIAIFPVIIFSGFMLPSANESMTP